MHRPTDNIDFSMDIIDKVTALLPNQRRAVILFYFGLTQCEIGQELGISHQAVSKLLESATNFIERLQNNPRNSSNN